MSHTITLEELHRWCAVPAEELTAHPERRLPFHLVDSSADMGEAMARTVVDEVVRNNREGLPTRAILPCGPQSWYAPFARIVNDERVSLARLVVFHMDECLDWQGRLLPRAHPYNFRTFMEQHFYDPIDDELAVPPDRRRWLTPYNSEEIRREIAETPPDITIGGWGQDGHVAYNQTRRNAYSGLTLDELRNASIRIQDNNCDTVLALAQRTLGTAYRFAPPMSVTLGMKECFAARKIRLFSDTGAWKQTALRVALFSPPTAEYPITLLQEHADAAVTATLETARHPISEHPEWDFFGASGYHDA